MGWQREYSAADTKAWADESAGSGRQTSPIQERSAPGWRQPLSTHARLYLFLGIALVAIAIALTFLL
jgi:hypothetical protein